MQKEKARPQGGLQLLTEWRVQSWFWVSCFPSLPFRQAERLLVENEHPSLLEGESEFVSSDSNRSMERT